MKNLCIIPARGGSKRIPKKNIKDFLGKPIIAYSIEAAINSRLFEEVMVSTDDDKIIEVAKKYGAKTPFKRSDKNSNDYATTIDVIKEVVNDYKNKNLLFDNICCFYPCSPFTSIQSLKQSYELMINEKFDSVFPVMPFSFPIQRALKEKDNKISFFYPQFALSRSQDLEQSYHDAGQFYWIKAEIIYAEASSIMTDNTGAVIISELEGQDIDNETDWQLAELKYKLAHGIS